MYRYGFGDYGPEREVKYTTNEFAELIGVCSRTLIRWDRNGTFKACRLPSGRPYYTDEQYYAYLENCHRPATKPQGKGRM